MLPLVGDKTENNAIFSTKLIIMLSSEADKIDNNATFSRSQN